MDSLKRVFSSDKVHHITIIRELLAEEGIESYVLDQKGSAFLLGEMHVYVSDKDYDKAKQIVDNHPL